MKHPIEQYETLLGELYQVLGVLGAPTEVLDQIDAALDGRDLPFESLLPFARYSTPKITNRRD